MSADDDAVYQTVGHIRRPDEVGPVLAAAWARAAGTAPPDISVDAGLTNYTPFDCARVLATVDVAGRAAPVTVFFHVFADAGHARDEAAKGLPTAEASGPPPVVLIEDWNAVVWALPATPKLEALPALMSAWGLRRTFSPPLGALPPEGGDAAPELFRYVPTRRGLLRWQADGRALFVKLYADRDADRQAANFRLLDQAAQGDGFAFAVPEVVAYDARTRCLLMSAVPGTPATDAMAAPAPDVFAGIGSALASLHGSRLQPVETWTAAAEVAELGRKVGEMAWVLPGLADRLEAAFRALRDYLPRLPATRAVPIHRKMFGDQVLIDGGRTAIVDWDSLALGDPLYDLGRLLAHAVYVAGENGTDAQDVRRAAAALIAAHGPVDGPHLAWHVSCALLMRAKISALRMLPDGWAARIEFMLDEAERTMAGTSPYLDVDGLGANR